MPIDIFDYIETNFGKLFTSYGIQRRTLHSYLGKNVGLKRTEVLTHKTNWFRRIFDFATGNSPRTSGPYAFIEDEELMAKINEDLFAFLKNKTSQKLQLLMDNPSSLPDHLDFLPPAN